MGEYWSEEDEVYHNLWQVKVVPASQIFAWRVFLNRMPTRDRLVELGISVGNSVYVVCNFTVESLCHLFFSCSTMSDI